MFAGWWNQHCVTSAPWTPRTTERCCCCYHNCGENSSEVQRAPSSQKCWWFLEHFFCRLGSKLSSCFSYLPKGKSWDLHWGRVEDRTYQLDRYYIFISQFNSNYLLFLLHIHQHHRRCIKAFDILCLNTAGKYEAVETRDRSKTWLRQLCDSRATGELTMNDESITFYSSYSSSYFS